MLNNLLGRLAFFSISLAVAIHAGAAIADPPGPGRRGPAVYDDWRLDCREPPCVAYGRVIGADGSELLRLSLPRGGAALVVRTTLPVFVAEGVMLAIGARALRTAPWRTCGPDGCEAWFLIDPDLLGSVRNERGAAVTLTLADGMPVRLTVSLRGSSAALRARDEIRAKAG